MVHKVLENIDLFLYVAKQLVFFKHVRYYTKSFLSIQLISLLQFFFIKCSNNFFTLRSLITYVHGTVFLTLLITKTFFRPIWCVSFSKNIFVFRNSYIITNFKYWIFIINFFFQNLYMY